MQKSDSLLLSVVITTFQRPFAMVEQAVQSVLAQTYAPIEVIVVSDNDPGSPWAAELKQDMARCPTVRLIQLPRNGGAQAARNRGIRETHGDFVGFLDDDDLWLPQKAEKQMPLFENPAVGLVYCRGYSFHDDDTETRSPYFNSQRGFNPSMTFNELLVRDGIGSTSQAIVRRSCFEDCGYFDEALHARQDYDRWLAITQKHLARGVDEPLFLHRIHGGDQITKNLPKVLAANAAVFQKYGEFYRLSPMACMAYYYNRAFVLLQMGRRRAFLGNALRSFFYSPRGFWKKYRSYRKEEA